MCDGQFETDTAHAATGCEVGALHTHAVDFAEALAAMINQPESAENADLACDALKDLGRDLARVIRDKPRVA
jgi:hypothetical protein